MLKEKKLPLIDQQTLTQITTLVEEHWRDLDLDASDVDPRRFTILYRESELACVLSRVSCEERMSRLPTAPHRKPILLIGTGASSPAKLVLAERHFCLTLRVGETDVSFADIAVSFHEALAPESVRRFASQQGVRRFFWIRRKRLHTVEAYRGRGYGSVLNTLEDVLFQQWATCKQWPGIVFTNDDSVQRWTSATLDPLGFQPIKRGTGAEILRRMGIRRIGKMGLGPRLAKVYWPQAPGHDGELAPTYHFEGVRG